MSPGAPGQAHIRLLAKQLQGAHPLTDPHAGIAIGTSHLVKVYKTQGVECRKIER